MQQRHPLCLRAQRLRRRNDSNSAQHTTSSSGHSYLACLSVCGMVQLPVTQWLLLRVSLSTAPRPPSLTTASSVGSSGTTLHWTTSLASTYRSVTIFRCVNRGSRPIHCWHHFSHVVKLCCVRPHGHGKCGWCIVVWVRLPLASAGSAVRSPMLHVGKARLCVWSKR